MFNMNNKDDDIKKKGLKVINDLITDKEEKFSFTPENDEKYSYKDIENIFPKYKKSGPCCAYIEWDDIIQYTTLGFLDYLYDEVFKYSQDDPKRIYAHDVFLERKNEYLDGIKFIEKVIRGAIDYDRLEKLFKKKYIEAVYRSPMSPFLHSFYNTQHIMNKVIFSFRGDLNAKYFQLLRDEIDNEIFKGGTEVEFINASLSNEEVLKMYDPKIFFVKDTAGMLQTAVQNNYDNREFYVNEYHNNFAIEFLQLLSSDNVNMNFIHDTHRLYFFKDKIYAQNLR